MSNRSALNDIVTLGGLALQAEDSLIRAALHHRGEHGGLIRMENERYHQFIIWRAALPIWHTVLERDKGTDIILERDEETHHFELKNLRGAGGDGQLQSMQSDVGRLAPRRRGYLLVTSCNPPELTIKNLRYLESKIKELTEDRRHFFQFNTVDTYGRCQHFWLAGWPVTEAKSPTAVGS